MTRAHTTTTPENDLDGSVEGVPAFRCYVNSNCGWSFRCTCGMTHTHGAGEGHRVGHCDSHRPGGYWLLAPNDAKEPHA